MTVEEQVYSALKDLFGGRLFPDLAPGGTQLPYGTYQAVGGEPINFISGDKPGKTNTRMQVNVWAATRIEASDLGARVEEAVRSATHLQPEVLSARVATYDETTQYRGTTQDFSVWS